MSQVTSTHTSKHTIFIDDGGPTNEQGVETLPVLFVHSLAGNTQQWSAQLEHLRKTRRAIAIDLRGHSRSRSPEDGDYTIDALAQDIHAAVVQLGIERFILVGHSMGGSVALAYAGAYPQHVAGLLLVDPSGDSTQMAAEEVEQYLGALQSEAYANVIEGYWQQLLTSATSAVQQQVMDDLRNTSPETIVGALKGLFAYNPLPALARYPGPKLSIITPANDVPFSLHALLPDLPVQRITDTGHWLHMDKPDAFNAILDDFVNLVEEPEKQEEV